MKKYFFAILIILIINFNSLVIAKDYPYIITTRGMFLKEQFEGDIYPSMRYLVGHFSIKINQENDPNPEVTFKYIRFGMDEKKKTIEAWPFSFSTLNGTIKNVSILGDDSFSFLIDFPPYNKILVRGFQTNLLQYEIEGDGLYTHWNEDQTQYHFKWTTLPEVKLPEWKICYGWCW